MAACGPASTNGEADVLRSIWHEMPTLVFANAAGEQFVFRGDEEAARRAALWAAGGLE